MGRRATGLLLALGVVAFLFFIAAFLPASLLTRFVPANVRVQDPQGTLWSGRAESVHIGPAVLGPVAWGCAALPLIVGRLRCDVAVTTIADGADAGPGHVDASVTLSRGRRVSVAGLRGTVPLASATALGIPRGWDGRLEFTDVGIDLDAGLVARLTGTVVAADLQPPRRRGARLGSYAIELGEGFASPGVIGGRLRDLAGPLSLRGTLRIDPRGRYLAEGEVAAGPGAPEDLLQTLGFLGPPDATGRRPFSIEGAIR